MTGSATTTQSSTTSANPYAAGIYQSALGSAQGLAQTPYNPLTNVNIAGLNQPQLTALGQLQNAYGTAQPYINQATNYANSAANPNTVIGNIPGFMNPYTQSVIGATMAETQQQQAIQQQQLQAQAAAQGALGGDRLGVAQGVLGGQQALANNQTTAGLNQANYAQALAAAEQNAGMQGQAAFTLGNLGNEALSTGITGAQAGLAAGNQLQQQQQNVLNAATQNAVQQTQWPFQTEQYLASIAGTLGPLLGGTSTGTTTQPVNYLGQIIGGGVAGLGLYNTLSDKLSDKRLKEDVKPIGKTFDGQTIFKYKYKGDPQTRIGLIAQQVEKKHPDAVGSFNGFKTVDYDKATKSAAERGHFRDGGSPRRHFDDGGKVSVFNLSSGPLGMSTSLQPGRGNFPSLPALPNTQSQQNQNDPLTQASQFANFGKIGSNIGSGLGNINQSLGSSIFGSNPTTSAGGWQTSTQPTGGFLGGLGNYLGFKEGGEVRKHYDDGGSVDNNSISLPDISIPKITLPTIQENPLGLSKNANNALINAGLSMMAAGPAIGSKNAFGALSSVGKGGVEGMKTYLTEEQQDRLAKEKADALAQQARIHADTLALQTRQAEETERHNKAQENLENHGNWQLNTVKDEKGDTHVIGYDARTGEVKEMPQYQSVAARNAAAMRDPAKIAEVRWVMANIPGASDPATAWGLVTRGVNSNTAWIREVQAEKNRLSQSVEGANMPDKQLEARAIETIRQRARAEGQQIIGIQPPPPPASVPSVPQLAPNTVGPNPPTAAIPAPQATDPQSAPSASPKPPAIPQRPTSLPVGSRFNPARQMWRDPQDNLYDAQGNPLKTWQDPQGNLYDAQGNPLKMWRDPQGRLHDGTQQAPVSLPQAQ